MSDSTFGMRGWICPKCDAVMSPTYPTCFYCGPNAGAVKPEPGTIIVLQNEWKVEAVRFDGKNFIEVLRFSDPKHLAEKVEGKFSTNGELLWFGAQVEVGDYIVKDNLGNISHWKKDIFEALYQAEQSYEE